MKPSRVRNPACGRLPWGGIRSTSSFETPRRAAMRLRPGGVVLASHAAGCRGLGHGMALTPRRPTYNARNNSARGTRRV
jgi:hypothetical protein